MPYPIDRKQPLRMKSLYEDFPFHPLGAAGTPTAWNAVDWTHATFGNTLARVMPFQVEWDIHVRRIFVSCPAASGTNGVEMAIYDAQGIRKWHTGIITTAPVTGIQTFSLAPGVLKLANGNYYFAVASKLSSGTQQWIRVTQALPGALIPRAGTMPVTAGALPASFNPITGITKTVGGFPAFVTLSEFT